MILWQVARVISSLLAAGILQMRGVHGRPGWFYLFLMEGFLTLGIGIIVSWKSWKVQSDLLANEFVEFALFAPFTDEYKKHSISQVLVLWTPGDNHDQCMSIESERKKKFRKLTRPASPPWRSVQRTNRNQPTGHSPRHQRRLERHIHVGIVPHRFNILHPPKPRPGIPLFNIKKNWLLNFWFKHALNPIRRPPNNSDAGPCSQQRMVRRTYLALLVRWVLVSAFTCSVAGAARVRIWLGTLCHNDDDFGISVFPSDCGRVDFGEYVWC